MLAGSLHSPFCSLIDTDMVMASDQASFLSNPFVIIVIIDLFIRVSVFRQDKDFPNLEFQGIFILNATKLLIVFYFSSLFQFSEFMLTLFNFCVFERERGKDVLFGHY
ncbi:hypothetical protein HanIR_Chr03g0112421 [Helianthus annuus]|nr:hypothetical protein HanIR_Chr03g0112421 [Helianthus annuus]